MTLRHWFRFRSPATAEAPASPADGEDLPRYPPFLRGLPTAPAVRIVATQPELIAGLQDALAFTDRRFAELVLPTVERYAAFVHLLPASEAHHHRGAGGLFRHGLEVARLAAQASQGRVFALDRSPGERRELEPRWRLAAALAGLCHDLGKPVSDLAVTDRDGGTPWRPLLESLTDWAQRQGVDRYFLRWREQRHGRHEAFGLLVLERVLTPAVTAWLTDADPEIMAGLLATVAGLDDAALGSLVRAADAASVERDLRENRLDPETVSLGMPLDRYLVDAMRRLVRSGQWRINVPGARLWLFPDGLHVVWPAGADDVVGVLAADRVPGIPRDPDTLADILVDRGLAVPRGPAQRYWLLAPAPLAQAGRAVVLPLLRLATPTLLLAGELPPVAALATPEPPTPAAGGDAPVSGSVAAGSSAAADAGPGPDTDPPARAPTDRAAVPTGAPSAGDAVSRRVGVASAAARAAAEEWCRRHGAGGEVLRALARRLTEDGVAHRCANGQWLVRFPDGLAAPGGRPQARLDALAAAGLLTTDPLAPMRHVREIDGQRGVLLSVEASQCLTGLADAAASAADASGGPGTVPGSEVPSVSEPPLIAAQRVARAFVQQVRARPDHLGAVADPDGWLQVGTEVVREVAARHAIGHALLLRTLGKMAGCRVEDGGDVRIRAAQDPARAGP